MATQDKDLTSGITRVTSLAALGQRIRSERKSQGLRIDDAAALCGISVDTLSRLENGHEGVSTLRMLRVLEGLGLTLFLTDAPTLRGDAARRKDAP
jgi:transcriptional regulator with XRE-family HTH domain